MARNLHIPPPRFNPEHDNISGYEHRVQLYGKACKLTDEQMVDLFKRGIPTDHLQYIIDVSNTERFRSFNSTKSIPSNVTVTITIQVFFVMIGLCAILYLIYRQLSNNYYEIED